MSSESSDPPPTGLRARFPEGFWAVVAIVAWALAASTLLDRAPYSIDEGTARVLLLLWSISDAVASPVAAFGIPDVRAVYLIPAGIPFSGSLLATKICTLLFLVAFAAGTFRWRRERIGAEGPRLSTGLLLLLPPTIAAIDAVATPVFLAFTLWAAAKVDHELRLHRVRFGGLYFVQILLVMAALTLHPAGLACPIVLAAGWILNPPVEPQSPAMIPGRERTHVLVGIAVGTLLGVLLATGWKWQLWFANPVTGLATAIFPNALDATSATAQAWTLGLVLSAAIFLTAWKMRGEFASDRLASMVTAGVAIGAFAGDACFVLLASILLLYWGFPRLLGARLGALGGFVGARGLGFLTLVALSSAFLLADRNRFETMREGAPRSAQDQLIEVLVQNVQRADAADAAARVKTGPGNSANAPHVASQWPGRTMLACRCASIPLPPSLEDQAQFEANLRGLDYVVFDPQDPVNRGLSHDFALLGGERVETLALRPGGVILHLRRAGSAGTPAGTD